MKVVCINNQIGNTKKLKLHQTYTRSSEEDKEWRLPDDYIILTNVTCNIYSHSPKTSETITIKELWCEKKCFITLEEFRSKQLIELGI